MIDRLTAWIRSKFHPKPRWTRAIFISGIGSYQSAAYWAREWGFKRYEWSFGNWPMAFRGRSSDVPVFMCAPPPWTNAVSAQLAFDNALVGYHPIFDAEDLRL